MRHKFQKCSELKLVSRTVPHAERVGIRDSFYQETECTEACW
jgi:hypothetical protein